MKRSLVYIISVVLATVSCINEKTEGADLAAGDLIPDFTVTMNDGTELTGAMLREAPSCIMFFHTSCPDCRQALPVMQKIYDEYASKGVRFALISREEEGGTIRFIHTDYPVPEFEELDKEISCCGVQL